MNPFEPSKEYDLYVSHSSAHGIFIQNDGSAMSFGQNYYGQLGEGGYKNHRPTPCPTVVLSRLTKNGQKTVKQISCGLNHTLFLMLPDEDVYGVGCTQSGELSHFSNSNIVNALLKLTSDELDGVKIVQIYAGHGFSALLGRTGNVYTCGMNGAGECGTGDGKRQYKAVKIKLDAKIIQICGGQHYLLMLCDKGDVYFTGGNIGGYQRNVPTKLEMSEKVKYIRCGFNHFIAIGKSGKLYGMGNNQYGAISCLIKRCNYTSMQHINDVKSIKNGKIKNVFCGASATYVLMDNGELYGWGYNMCGQITGDVTKMVNNSSNNALKGTGGPFLIKRNVIAFEVGQYCIFVLLKDGWYSCGSHYYGRMGNGAVNAVNKLTRNKHIVNVRKNSSRVIKRINFNEIVTTTLPSTSCCTSLSQITFTFGDTSDVIKLNLDIACRSSVLKGEHMIKLPSIEYKDAVKSIITWLSGGTPSFFGINVKDFVKVFELSVDWKLHNFTWMILNQIGKEFNTVQCIVDILFETHKKEKMRTCSLSLKCLLYLKRCGPTSYVSYVMTKMKENSELSETLFKLSEQILPDLESHVDIKGLVKDYNNSDHFLKHMERLYTLDNDALKDVCFKTSNDKYIKVHSHVIKKIEYMKNLLTGKMMGRNNVIEVDFPHESLCPILLFIYDPKLFDVYDYEYYTLMKISVHSKMMGIVVLSEMCEKHAREMKKHVDLDVIVLENIETKIKLQLGEKKRKEIAQRLCILEEKLSKFVK